MNHGTKTTGLPDLTANLLRDGGCLIDNLFADTPRNNDGGGQDAGAGGGHGEAKCDSRSYFWTYVSDGVG